MRFSRRSIQRKTLSVVVIAQVFGGAGFAAVMTSGSLLAEQMLGGQGMSGLAVGLFMLGTAIAAYGIGGVSQRRGRRIGLALGFAAGGIGGLAVVMAAAWNLVGLLFVALFVYGAGFAASLQARYAGTDLARPEHRGFAISVSLVSTTLGAVIAPNLLAPAGVFASFAGLPALTGLFLLGGAAYLLAGAIIVIGLVPDPYLLARRVRLDTKRRHSALSLRDAPLAPTATLYAGAAIMVAAQITMMATVAMTPIHMQDNALALGAIGIVIGTHIGTMYFPSLVTGALVDRVGRIPMAVVAAVLMVAACLLAALGPAGSLTLMLVAMILLGLGWNCGLIAGSAMVVDATRPEDRPRVQGSIDVLIAVGAAIGSTLSGVVVANLGYPTLACGCAVIAALLIPLALWVRTANSRRSGDVAAQRAQSST